MSKFNYDKIMPRYSFFAFLLTLIAVAVLARAGWIMTADKSYWMQVADRVKQDSVKAEPIRGNILASNGQLLASSLPEFKIHMDFEQLHVAGTDSLWNAKLDSICMGLHDIFPEKSAAEFKAHLTKGFNKRRVGGKHNGERTRYWLIWPKRIDYNTYCEVKKLPVFRLSKLKSGFGQEEFYSRENPYGSLAGRTVGDMYKGINQGRTARCGLELSYDSLLRGKYGIVNRRKVLAKTIDITVRPPENGCDIVTTIDVGMQDLAERAVLDKLKEIDGNVGVAIVMEVKTGDVKAIVNMEKCVDGEYREIKNHAVSDLMEPGSVFKTASLITALEDGVVDTSFQIPTGNGIWHVYGRDMKDSHWRTGGSGTISLCRAMELSSNIGISYTMDKFYHNNPEKFVRGLYRTGIHGENVKIPIAGHATPQIRMPQRYPNGQWKNWSNTALMWMSIGYETQIPPIYTLAFYNAIANNGKMMQPRFVKSTIQNDGTMIDYPPEVVKGHEQIASPKTIKIVQDVLHKVVLYGTGRKANSPNFWVCGKTGTAMIASNGNYHGPANHLLSFAGWFGDKDKPYYSCIVCIQKRGLPAYGWMSGQVFKAIAEGIMAKFVRYDVTDVRDSTYTPIPDVKNGDVLSAGYVLSALGINAHTDFTVQQDFDGPVWGTTEKRPKTVMLRKANYAHPALMPDVHGMGARDAVYLVESRGVKCIIQGRGKVTAQSIGPGMRVKRGQKCVLTLE